MTLRVVLGEGARWFAGSDDDLSSVEISVSPLAGPGCRLRLGGLEAAEVSRGGRALAAGPTKDLTAHGDPVTVTLAGKKLWAEVTVDG